MEPFRLASFRALDSPPGQVLGRFSPQQVKTFALICKKLDLNQQPTAPQAVAQPIELPLRGSTEDVLHHEVPPSFAGQNASHLRVPIVSRFDARQTQLNPPVQFHLLWNSPSADGLGQQFLPSRNTPRTTSRQVARTPCSSVLGGCPWT